MMTGVCRGLPGFEEVRRRRLASFLASNLEFSSSSRGLRVNFGRCFNWSYLSVCKNVSSNVFFFPEVFQVWV